MKQIDSAIEARVRFRSSLPGELDELSYAEKLRGTEDPLAMLTLYHDEAGDSVYDPVRSQQMLAERLAEIGETDKAFQFTVLAEQARIANIYVNHGGEVMRAASMMLQASQQDQGTS